MGTQAKQPTRRKQATSRADLLGLMFDRICYERCSKSPGALNMILTTRVALSIPPHCSHRSQIERIAASACQPIESLSNELDGHGSPRGSSFFNFAATCIDQIAANYTNMRWWVTEKGLNVGSVDPRLPLSEFDVVAGELLEEHWKGKRLSKESLLVVARALDEKKLSLNAHLQPGHWTKISHHNMTAPKRAIKTFQQAASNPLFVRGVRKRLYVARSRFRSCQNDRNS